MPDGSVSITRASVDHDELKALIREAVSEVATSTGGNLPLLCVDVFASSFRDALAGGRALARLERECGLGAVVVALVTAAHASVGGRARFVESYDPATVALSFALEAWTRDAGRGFAPARELSAGIEAIASAPSESDDEIARDLLLLATFVLDDSAKVPTEVRGREAVRLLATHHDDSDEDAASVAALRALESAIDHARTWRESNARREGRTAA